MLEKRERERKRSKDEGMIIIISIIITSNLKFLVVGGNISLRLCCLRTPAPPPPLPPL